MQTIIRETARKQLEIAIKQSQQTFGVAVATKFYNRFMEYARRLSTNTELGFPEPLLSDRRRNYRSLIINEHFKLVY